MTMIDFHTLSDSQTTVNVSDGVSYQKSAYLDFAWDVLKQFEAAKTLPYYDSADSHFVTIGVGFNMEGSDEALKIIIREALGEDPALVKVYHETSQSLLAAVKDAMNEGTRGTSDSANDALQARLNAIAVAYTDGAKTTFGLADDSDATMRPIWDKFLPTYTDKVNTWLADIPASRERVVLLSLAYNEKDGTTALLGNGLKNAILDDDRPEAWFEIRYGSNLHDDKGTAKRRYIESHVFDLYNETNISAHPTIDRNQALQVFRMFTKHETKITDYDKNVLNLAGFGLAQDDLNGISANWGTSLGTVENRHDSFTPAFDFLKGQYDIYRANVNDALTAANFTAADFASAGITNVFVATNASVDGVAAHTVNREIQGAATLWTGGQATDDNGHNDMIWGSMADDGSGNLSSADDVLKGGAGNDYIIDNGGNDQLSGGIGNDILIAGIGNDQLDGGDGDDALFGQDGDDVLKPGTGRNYVDGGAGSDTVDYGNLPTGESATIINDQRNPAQKAANDVLIQHGSSTDVLENIEKLKLSGNADTFKVFQADLHDGKVDHLVSVDAGANPANAPDVLDLTGVASSGSSLVSGVVFYNDHIVQGNNLNAPTTTFTNFEMIKFGDGNDRVQTSQKAIIYLGGGNDLFFHGAPGTIVFTGPGHDEVHVSPGVAYPDLDITQDHLVVGTLDLHGGLRNMASASVWAQSLGGMFQYGKDSAGELVVHLSFLPSIVVTGADGDPYSVAPDVYLTNYEDAAGPAPGGGEYGPAGITLAEVGFSVYNVMHAPPGGGSVQSQLDVYGLQMKTLIGTTKYGGVDPLVLDLGGNGFDLTARTSVSPMFDLDADLYGERAAWVLPQDGFLVRDIDGDGKIGDGSEMFSASMPGFTALGLLDGNADGVVNAADNGLADFNSDGTVDASDTFATLKVWVDDNQNGQTDAGELHALSDYDITGFNLATTAANTQALGSTLTETASFTRGDGSTGTFGEWLLHVDNMHTTYTGPEIAVSTGAAAEPDLKGYGTLVGLHQALTEHPEYIANVEAALAGLDTPDLGALKNAALPVLYDWAKGSPVRLPNGDVVSGDDSDPSANVVPLLRHDGASADYAYAIVKQSVVIDDVSHLDGTWTFISGVTVEIIVAEGQPLPDITTLHDVYGAAPTPTEESVVTDGITYLKDTYSYSNGATMIVTHRGGTTPDVIDAVLGGSLGSGDWDRGAGAEIAFIQRYMGETLPLNAQPGDTTAMLHALDQMLGVVDTEMQFLAVRLAVQAGPLAPIFAGIHYDVAADQFVANGAQQLAPVYENLFTLAEGQADPIAYLAGWKPFLDIVMGDYSQGYASLANTYGFIAQNIIGAYEAVSPGFALLDAADTLGVPRDLFVTGPGTMTGTDDADIFYLDGSGQTAHGGLGPDTYVVGQHVGTTVIADVEPVLQPQSDDMVRFTTLNPGDVAATRDGTDLVLTVTATGETLRITDQFTGPFPGPLGGQFAPDNGVAEIVFADGTVWQKVDMAFAVAHPLPSGGTQTGTSAIDVFVGGPGDDLLQGMGNSDIYQIAPGGGHDTIVDTEDDFARNSMDVLTFTGGLRPQDLTYTRDGDSSDVTIGFHDAAGTVTIHAQFEATETGVFGTLYSNQIELIAFDDGEMISYQDVMSSTLNTYETAGNDHVYGFSTDDAIDGQTGNDYLSGENGNDTYTINLGYGNDVINDANSNLLTGQNDTVAFGPGIAAGDLTFSRDGNSNDLLITIGDSGQTLAVTNQFLAVETGPFGVWWEDRIEQFTFADGGSLTAQDVILSLIASHETAGADTIYGFHGDDTLDGGAGNDFLQGGDGNDTYIFGRGYGHDVVDDGEANVLSGSFDQVVFNADIAPGDLVLARGVDPLDLEISVSGTSDHLTVKNEFAANANGAATMNQVEEFHFSDGTVWTVNDIQLALLASVSTAGNDTIVGFAGDDRIDGGTGNDLLSGRDGADTYVFARGYGSDVIDDQNWITWSSLDTVEFQTGIAASDLLLSRDGDDLIIHLRDPGTGLAGSEQLRIEGQFDLWINDKVEQFTFVDSPATVLTNIDLQVMYFAQARTAGDDTIVGTQAADTLDGGAGNDVLKGGDGNDTYIFDLGYGHDTVSDWNGNLNYSSIDTVQFGAGIAPADVAITRSGYDLVFSVAGHSDTLTIQNYFDGALWVVENFAFADGTVWHPSDIASLSLSNYVTGTTGNDALSGTVGSDVFDGLGGSDTASGGGGNDTFVFNPGYGHLEVSELDLSAARNNVVQLGAGITPGDVTVTADYIGHMYLNMAGGDQIKLLWELGGGHDGVQHVVFADGTSWSWQDLITLETTGTTGNDTIYGTPGADVLDAKGGNDYVQGGGGNDTILFNAGYGHLEISELDIASGASNVLQFGAGIAPAAVTVTADYIGNIFLTLAGGDQVRLDHMMQGSDTGVQHVTFADGTSWSWRDVADKATTGTTGADSLYGSPGADTFDGKGGNDYVQGSGGGDTIAYNAGYGHLEVYELDFASAPSNRVHLGSAIAVADTAVTSDSSGNILITDGVSGDQIKIDDMLGAGYYGISGIDFADGTAWSRSEILARADASHVVGTSGADNLTGTSGFENFDGLGGNDVAHGGGGNDIFQFTSGYGHLEIDEVDTAGGANNILQLHGISASSLAASVDMSGNVVLTDGVGGDQITLDGMANAADDGIQGIDFGGGTTWTRAQVMTLANGNPVTGTTGADSLSGTSGRDMIDGLGGNDYVSGGGGSDTILYHAGYGHLEVYEFDFNSSANNIVRFAAGIAPGDVTVGSDGSSLFLYDGVGGDRVQLDDQIGAYYYGVQAVAFSDGTVWSRADLYAKEATGTAGNDSLYGPNSAQAFDAKGGNDYIQGGGGDDSFAFNAGYGHLEIYELDFNSSANNVLHFGAGIAAADVAVTSDGSNLFLTDGVSGDQVRIDNMLNGTYYGAKVAFADGTVWSRADVILKETTGTTGANSLYGTGASETFDGKGGTDYASGGGGNDVFLFNSGYGHLEVSEIDFGSGANNVIHFGAGIDPGDVSITNDGSNVFLHIGAGGDQIEIDNMLNGYYWGIHGVSFADGTAWSRADIIG